MEFIEAGSIVCLESDFQDSYQLLWNENSNSERVTITRVHVRPKKINPRHRHEGSEQIWIALEGAGTLLLENGTERRFVAGDVVRFADGDTHGIANDSDSEFFVYLSVTAPPINFRCAYNEQ